MSSSEQPISGRDLEAAAIIPDVLPARYTTGSFALFPVHFAHNGAVVDRGNTLRPSDAQQPQYSLPPSIASSSTAAADLYCVIVYDPDGPSRRNPRFRNIVHLIHANIPGTAFPLSAEHNTANVSSGNVHVPYRPPGPPQGAGPHRYVWLLYRQSAAIDTAQLPSFGGMSGASKQKPAEMEERLRLLQGERGALQLVAVNWHEAEWEPWVTQHMRERFGWMAVPIMWLLKTFVV